MALEVALVSPERILYTGEAEMVVCRTSEGEIAFLSHHAPFVGTLGIGLVRVIQAGGEEIRAAVHGGFVEVRDNKVSILSDVAELPDQVDAARATRAREAAEQRIRDGDDPEAEAALRRANTRLSLVGEGAR